MAHKVCIGGTAYEIDGGKAMVDGAVYEIDHGVANVDGTVYKVEFTPAIPVITTSSAGYSSEYVNYAYIEFVDVKGNTYKVDSRGGAIDIEASMAAGAPVWTNTFEIPAGTAITCFVRTGTQYTPGYVKVNGTKVLNKTSGSGTYAYVVTGDASVKLYTYGNSSSNAYGYIEITET